MKVNGLNKITEQFGNTEKMPVLFLGHGSPMNAIEENEFVTGWRSIGKTLPKPTQFMELQQQKGLLQQISQIGIMHMDGGTMQMPGT